MIPSAFHIGMNGSKKAPYNGFIANGLELYLDGIDYGETAGYWIDLSGKNNHCSVSGWTKTDDSFVVADKTSGTIRLNDESKESFCDACVNEATFIATINLKRTVFSSGTGGLFSFIGSKFEGVYCCLLSNYGVGTWGSPVSNKNNRIEVDSYRHDFVLAFSGKSAKYYVDGVLIDGIDGNLQMQTSRKNGEKELYIGSANGLSGFRSEEVISFRAYSRELSSDEIVKDHNVSMARFNLA